MNLSPALALALVLVAAPARSGLDDTESRLVQTIEARQAEALALLTESVNINSGTLNFDGVRAVGDLFGRELAGLGFSTRWIDGAAFDRAGHLVATHGDRGPHFLLIGHLDTVFEPDSPFQRFEPVDAAHALGPGTTDMKGGNVIILEALHALKEAGALDRMTFTVFLTGDEERSGRPLDLARAEFIAAADAADYALGFEDGDGDPATAVISRRGSSPWTLTVGGTPAHSSQVFSDAVGFGAVFELARILDRFRTALADEKFLTFNPGMVVAGTEVSADPSTSSGRAYGKSNVIAAEAIVNGDIRSLTPEQLASAQERMRRIVAESLPGTSASIEFRDGYPPLAPTEGNRRLLALYDAASRDLGFGPVAAVDPEDAGAADVSFTSGRVRGALCGLGLMGTGGHTENETADLRTLNSQAQRAALLIWRLAALESGR
jgi:glutamate carboxypeptidase